MNDQRLLGLKSASKISGAHQDYLRVLINRKSLKGTKIGRDWFVAREDLDAYFNGRKKAKLNGNAVSGIKISNRARLINKNPGAVLSSTLKTNLAYVFNSDNSYKEAVIVQKDRYVSSDFNQKLIRKAVIAVSVVFLIAGAGFWAIYRTGTINPAAGKIENSLISLQESLNLMSRGVFNDTAAFLFGARPFGASIFKPKPAPQTMRETAPEPIILYSSKAKEMAEKNCRAAPLGQKCQ